MDTPLLLIAWRRPQTLRQVIDAIRPVAPTRLYVACDGPNPERPGEAEKVAATRAVIESEIDWPCHIERLYSNVNQGCRLGVSRAISWFFEQVEEGIILEDDCLPAQSFFPFCEGLLARYRTDSRVWQISGSTFFPDAISPCIGDYFFSRYGPIWGWATWRRAWLKYDSDLIQWPAMSDSALMKNVYQDSIERGKKYELGSKLYAHLIDTWDYQWGFCKNYNSGLTIIPKSNQIVNIGFSQDATHTLGAVPNSPDKAIELTMPICHPQFVNEDMAYSGSYCNRVFHSSFSSRIINKIFMKSKKFFK
jgi:hypothetical protein